MIIDKLDVNCHRPTVHQWVHKADLQPTDGADPDHIAVNETEIQLNDKQHWLYAAVDPATNRLLPVAYFRREHRHSPGCYFSNSARNISPTMRPFSSMAHHGCRPPATVTEADSSMKNIEIGTPSNVSLGNKTTNQPVLKLV